ncbi:sodium-coupled monocarboxylate transporter 2-like [Photinus pyralis]|uniref:sodium-coupled monocarboxylate transporter 2-like n=1 Tax=Photinus pyralis TaxID=7054 RepID=UPI0012674938|nr:sodium-coupled monocarboxylate transporter 2-like [Photinus pyralis]
MPFEIIDHVVFYGSMAFSLGIGVYFGFWKKSHTSDGYLLANRQMKVIPITISMVASSISGITLLGYSGEVYVYGANIVWMCLSCVVASVIGGCMFVPVLTKLKSPNVFKYFELRFDRRTKILASCAYTLYVLFFSSVVAYAPAIAFSQVTAVHPQIVASLVCVVCVFYTSVGGFRAVVWTDVFQFFGIIAGVIVVAVLGIASVGGVGAVIEKASNGHRLNFNIDPTQRDGFWQMLLGSTTTWIFILSLQPGTVQKYLSLSTSKNVTRVMVLQCFGIATISFVSIFMGLIVYAKYDGCDPLTTGEVARSDQILPYFLVDVVRDIPGLSGIFIAGLFSASLSTLSASLNTLGATVYGDLMSLHVFRGIMKDKESLILKLIVVGSGGICTALTCVVQHMGGIIPFAMVIVGLLNGIFCGLFSLGMIFPRANSKAETIAAFFPQHYETKSCLFEGYIEISQWMPSCSRMRSRRGK